MIYLHGLKPFVRLLPMLVTRLVLSLKKAADSELGVEWRIDHFTIKTEQRSTPLSFELRSIAGSSISSRTG